MPRPTHPCLVCGKPISAANPSDICRWCKANECTIVYPDDLEERRRIILRQRMTEAGFPPDRELPSYDHTLGTPVAN